MNRRTETTEKSRSTQQALIDRKIVKALENAGVNFYASVPCGLLDGILKIINHEKSVTHVPVTREEEGVGICAGAYLGGVTPALLMQNSGLGNSVNALLSLTGLYHIGLLLVIGYRGRRGEEQIEAQIPMGTATTKLLDIVQARYMIIDQERGVETITSFAKQTRDEIRAVLLSPKVWK